MKVEPRKLMLRKLTENLVLLIMFATIQNLPYSSNICKK